MTALPGRVDWMPSDLDSRLDRLVDVLPVIHATFVPCGCPHPVVPAARAGPGAAVDAASPGPWESAIEIYLGPAPTTDRMLIHRDHHPGNVLWARRSVTGIVDWVNASLGALEAGVGPGSASSTTVAARFLAATWP